MVRLEFILLAIVGIMISVPFVIAYVPAGDNIWFKINPATNSTRGGVFAFNCPSGELAYAILENGTVLCAVP